MKRWETRLALLAVILASLSALLQQKLESVRDLQLYRKALAAQMA